MIDERGIAFRYLGAQKKRTVLITFGVMLAIALVASIFSCLVAVQQFEVTEYSENGPWHVGAYNLTSSQVKQLRSRADVSASGIVSGVNPIVLNGKLSGQMTGCGDGGAKESNIVLKSGRFPESLGEIAIEQWAINKSQKGAGIGDKIAVTLPDGKTQDFTICGILKDNSGNMQNEYPTCAISLAQALKINKTDKVVVFMQVRDNVKISTFLSSIEKEQKIPAENTARHTGLLIALGRGDTNLAYQIYLVGGFLAALVLIAATVMIYNAFNSSVKQRTRQFGMLRALGATPKQLRRQVRSEAGFIWLFGTVPGLLISILVTAILIAFLKHFVPEIFFSDGPDFVFSPMSLGVGAVFGLLTTFLSSWLPARRAGKISPVEAMSGARKLKTRKKSIGGSTTKILPVESAISLRQIRFNKRSFVLTAVSLAIGIILLMSFEPMMDMLRLGTASTNEFGSFLVTRTESSKTGKMIAVPDNTVKEVSQINGVESARTRNFTMTNATFNYSILGSEYKYGLTCKFKKAEKASDGTVAMQSKSDLFGLSDEDLKSLSSKIVFGAADPAQLDSQNGVIVSLNDQRSFSNADLRPGDFVKINGKDHKVCGIIRSNPMTDFLTPPKEKVLLSVFTTKKVYDGISSDKTDALCVTLKANADGDKVLDSIKDKAKPVSNLDVNDMRDNKKLGDELTLAGEVFIYGFIIVIALIGVLNIINTVSTNIYVRTREIGLMRAGGMTTGQVAAMIVSESALYGILALIIGLAVGIPLEHQFFNMIVKQAYCLPWSLPWNLVVISCIITAAAVMLSVIAPAKRVKKLAVTEAVSVE